MNSSRPNHAHAWIRNNILGMVAIFIALSGSAAAATVVIKHGSNASAKGKASKKAKAKPGPQGSTGPAGAPGATGAQGPGAVRLTFSQPETDDQDRIVATVNELTMIARCGTEADRATLYVQFQSSVGGGEIEGTREESVDDGVGYPLNPIAGFVPTPPNTGEFFVVHANPGGSYKKNFVEATFFSSGRAISLQLYAVANDGGGICEVHGTAVPAG
jgi:hypothetical protein